MYIHIYISESVYTYISVCISISESVCCTPEINTLLIIYIYILIKKINIEIYPSIGKLLKGAGGHKA